MISASLFSKWRLKDCFFPEKYSEDKVLKPDICN